MIPLSAEEAGEFIESSHFPAEARKASFSRFCQVLLNTWC